jgi:hypothetical protein
MNAVKGRTIRQAKQETYPLLPLLFEDASSSNKPKIKGEGLCESVEDEAGRCYCGELSAFSSDCFFCYPCGYIFCLKCWKQSPPHKRQRVQGGIPHEKADPRLSKIIEQTLEADMDEQTQTRLHFQDESTTWFGINSDEDDEDLVFQDYGRFADLIAEMASRKRQRRYPGLVSFVGQTGAGKSTLVRLLIEV